jgi:hypothetical protein
MSKHDKYKEHFCAYGTLITRIVKAEIEFYGFIGPLAKALNLTTILSLDLLPKDLVPV